MEKFRRVVCVIVCMVMLVCLFPTSASAAVTRETHEVRSSYGPLATAEASLEVQSEDGTASLIYDAIAATMTVRLYLQEENDTNGSLAWKNKVRTAEDTSSLTVFKIAGSNTTIVAGYALLDISTTVDLHKFRVDDLID